MAGWLKELAEQYGLLWITLKWTVGVFLLLLVGVFVARSLAPRPVLVLVVENRMSDSLLDGRLSIRGRDADRLEELAPGAMARFVAKVPSEADVGVRFSRNGKADVETWVGGHFGRGDTMWTAMTAAGDSLERQAKSEMEVRKAVAEAVDKPTPVVADSPDATPLNPKQAK